MADCINFSSTLAVLQYQNKSIKSKLFCFTIEPNCFLSKAFDPSPQEHMMHRPLVLHMYVDLTYIWLLMDFYQKSVLV